MITVTLNLDLDCTKEIEWYVKSKLPELINEKLFENPQELNKLIKKPQNAYLYSEAIVMSLLMPFS